METLIQIGSRLELLLDDYLTESMRNVSFELHRPCPAEKVLSFDEPWEGPNTDYVTVFKDGDRYRMYYACHPFGFSGEEQFTGYAESSDGIQWTKPRLGLFEFQGSKDNNIVWHGQGSHNFSPFIDPAPKVPDDARYKAIGGDPLYPFASPDAIHWRKLNDAPMIPKDHPAFDRHKAAFWGNDPAKGRALFDSHNVAFWDSHRQLYRCYFRAWTALNEGQGTRIRTVFHSTSRDFLRWSDPEPVQFSVPPSLLDQFYTNGILPYFRAPHLYLGFPMRYVSRATPAPDAPKDGLGEGAFMFSRDGRRFQRYMDAFLRPGPDVRNWSKHSNMIAWGLLPTAEGEISIYYTQHYYAKSAHLRRGVLRTDGFVSLNAPYEGGEFTTKALVFSGHRLILNVATGAAGSVRVEIQDAEGMPMKGYALEDCAEFFGDRIAHTVTWNSGSDVGSLAGRPVRLRFAMRDADLYSLQFKE